MYIRLKRKNQTVFLHIDPSDNFSQIKQRISSIFHVEPAAVMLLASDKVKSFGNYLPNFIFDLLWLPQKRELLDLATVSDQEIKDDEVVYMIFGREGGGGWEDLQVDTLMPLGYEDNQAATA